MCAHTYTPQSDRIKTIPDSAAIIGIDADGHRHFVGNRPADEHIYVDIPGAVLRFRIGDIPNGFDGWLDHMDWDRLLHDMPADEHLAMAFEQ